MAEYSRLETVAQVDDLIASSHERPVVFFKHSLTCPISGAGFKEYQAFLEQQPDDDSAIYTLIEIQNARDISNEVTQRTGVKHESPQALVMNQGEITWHASHWSIRASKLADAVNGG
ncbi:MAG: bacillithiol system redox-active protein YtxJ [Acidobacteriota bacterium]